MKTFGFHNLFHPRKNTQVGQRGPGRVGAGGAVAPRGTRGTKSLLLLELSIGVWPQEVNSSLLPTLGMGKDV